MGIVSALGDGVEATRQALFAREEPAPHLPRRFETQLKLPVFEIPDPPSSADGASLPVRLLLHALDEALKNARLSSEDLRTRRVGIAVGTTVACQLDNIPCHARIRRGDFSDLGPALTYTAGMPAEYLRRRLGTDGPALTISNACASGADALMIALEWLRTGRCDLVISGGCDSVSKVAFDGFNALRVCSDAPCRPFDADRSGLNLGDAAGVLILEPPGRAAARGVAVTFELGGAGKSSDGFHITQPEPSGRELERAIRLAVTQACLDCKDIDFVNAHGTGTRVNDRTEGAVLGRVFGQRLRYQSTKALTGHTLGAAGAIEAVFTCLMLAGHRAAANRRCGTPDPDLAVPPLKDDTDIPGNAAVSTSLAFGGSNTALVFRRCRPDAPDAGPVPVYVEDFILLPPGAPEREELASLCRKYGLRRPDRLTQMALAAAERLSFPPGNDAETALITATAYGPAATTCRVIDDILDYPEEEILPTGFSHSVINAASSYLTAVRGIRGPAFALAGFEDPFREAADLARTLLAGKVCRRVLIVAADEESLISRAVERLRKKGFPASAEGACALLLSSDPQTNRLGTLEISSAPGDSPRLLPCGIPASFAKELACAGPDSRTVLKRLPEVAWRL
jgi:3-oxoacyl-(acyl-carrier-protein) synthase